MTGETSLFSNRVYNNISIFLANMDCSACWLIGARLPGDNRAMTALVAIVLLYLLLRSRLVMAVIGLAIMAAIVEAHL